MASVLVLMALVVGGFVGWLLGARRERARNSMAGDMRQALARAWQEGYDADHPVGDRSSTSTVAESRPVEAAASVAEPEQGRHPGFPLAVPRGDGPASPGPVAPSHHPIPPSDQARVTTGVVQAAPPRTAQERENATLRNINITLYAASLLLVAAASLFIGLAMPPLAKFGGLLAVTTMFYAGGLLIHAFSERLRPAGVAFAGTGLALIPVCGLALSALVVHNPTTAWWITSLVGTVAFVHAAARLNSRVVAYLSLTFLVSSAWAGGAVLNRGLFWYFMFSMVLAAAGTALAYGRPAWLGNLYIRAFNDTHRFLAPATLLTAVLLGPVLGAEDVALLLIAGTIYYVAVTIFGPSAERLVNLVAARVCATGAIVLLTYVFGAGSLGVARSLGIVLLLQALAVHRAGERYRHFVAPQVRGLVGAEVQGLIVAILGLALLLNEGLVASARALGELGGAQGVTGWVSINYLLPLVAVTAAGLSARGRKLLPWIALVAGVAGLLEPGAVLAPWRQVAFLVVGLACTIPGLRGAVGRQARWLRRGVLVVLPTTLATIAAWAASGFIVTTSVAGPGIGAWLFGDPVRWVGGGADPRVVMFVAGLVFVVSWMAVAARAAWRMEPGFMLASVAVVAVAEARLGTLEQGRDPWTTAVAMGTLVLAVVGSNALLGTLSHGRGRTARRTSVVAHGVAPLAIAATWLAGFGIENRWLVLAVCLAGLGHAGWRLASARSAVERGAYAVAAQLFFSLSLLELAHQLQADEHTRWALFAISLAVGQTTRLWLRRRGDGSQPAAYGPVVANVTVALLFLTPLAYLVIQGGVDPEVVTGRAGSSGVDLASLIVQYLCLLVVGLVKWRAGLASAATASNQGETATKMQILVVGYALAWLVFIPSGLISLRQGGWLPELLWNSTVVLVLLLFMALLVIAFEALPPATAVRRRLTRLVAGEEDAVLLGRSGSGPADSAHAIARAIVAAAYLGLAAVVVLGDGGTSVGSNAAPIPGGDIWLAAILLAAAAGCGVFAVTLGLPLLLTGTVVLLPWAVFIALAQWAGDAGSLMGRSRLYMASAVCSAILLYAAGWLHRVQVRPASGVITVPRSWSWLHGRILSGGAIVLLFIDGTEANVAHAREGSFLLDPPVGAAAPTTMLAFIGTAMIAVSAVAAVAEFPRRHRERCGEAAALVLAGCAQHAWHLAYGQPGLFWMAQYWVLVLALLAAYEIRAGRRKDADYPLIASAALLSASAPLALALELGWGQTWLLLAHVLLLAAGLLLNRRLYVVWGAVAAALLVLWFLRGFTILMLAALAAGLIALAIWRLQRLGKDKAAQPAPMTAPEGPDPLTPTPTPRDPTNMSASDQYNKR